LWGQSVRINDRLNKALDKFCDEYDTVILTDRISNCTHSNAVTRAFVVLKAMTIKEQEDLAPDFVITLGGNIVFNSEIKYYLKRSGTKMQNWQVGNEVQVCDAFQKLTEMFEMNESTFFEKMLTGKTTSAKNSYFKSWDDIASTINEPVVGYSQLNAIGQLIAGLPKNAVLHLSNSNAIRMGHLFDIEKSIKCFCIRGVNGIDGCMSTAVGYAAAADQPLW
jgi:2-succinyl-5-enolpyruvyl-6-hydroxy-3-cyclohexene-1-carboxylate synthase